MFKKNVSWLFVISSILSASAEYPKCRDIISGLPGNFTAKDQCTSNKEAYNVYGIRTFNCYNCKETCCINPASGTPQLTEGYKKRISALGCNKTNTSDLSYLVAIGDIKRNVYIFHCVGTLISPKFALTAASCETINIKSTFVQVGFFSNDELGEVILASVEDYIPHENFDAATLTNDIALWELILPQRFELSYACLWQTDAVYAERLMGFGSEHGIFITSRNTTFSRTPTSLQSVYLKASSCSNNLTEHEMETKICLSNFDDWNPPCLKGGGPVIAEIGNTPYVVAIPSLDHCLSSRQTRVSYYLDWIEDHVWKVNNSLLPSNTVWCGTRIS